MPTPLKFRTVLLRCARFLSEEINVILASHQLNYSLWQVVYLINERQGITSIEIAKYLQVSKPAIAKRVQRLIELDILEQADSIDKREKKLALTQHGHSIYLLCSELIDTHEQSLISAFDSEELDQSIQILSKVLSALENQKMGDSK